jgi:hypothetical protein
MEVKLDAIIAEIARNIDFELLEGDPKFDSLPRSAENARCFDDACRERCREERGS